MNRNKPCTYSHFFKPIMATFLESIVKDIITWKIQKSYDPTIFSLQRSEWVYEKILYNKDSILEISSQRTLDVQTAKPEDTTIHLTDMCIQIAEELISSFQLSHMKPKDNNKNLRFMIVPTIFIKHVGFDVQNIYFCSLDVYCTMYIRIK